MKEINIKIKNISQKQWPLFLIELNLMAKTWKRFGPVVNCGVSETPNNPKNLPISLGKLA